MNYLQPTLFTLTMLICGVLAAFIFSQPLQNFHPLIHMAKWQGTLLIVIAAIANLIYLETERRKLPKKFEVKIVGLSLPTVWYTNCVGEKFEVIESKNYPNDFILANHINNFHKKTIAKNHCILVK